jgi:hypothetical protein
MLPLDRLRSSFAAGLSMGMLTSHSMKQACQVASFYLRLGSHGPGAIGRNAHRTPVAVTQEVSR